MKIGSQKNRMFAQQIRKKDRQKKKSDLRSKFWKKEEQMMQCQSQIFRIKFEFLNENTNGSITNFTIAKLILASIHNQFVEQRLKSNLYSTSIIQKLFIADKDYLFTLNIADNNHYYPLQLTIGQLLQFIRVLPRQIFKIVASISQNIKIYKDLMSNKVFNDKSTLSSQQNTAITQSFRQSSLKKIKEVYQLRVIGQYCRQYLEAYSKMSQNIQFQNKNSDLIQIITDSLIEITAFRAQILKLCAYQSSLKSHIIQINQQMQKLKQFINTQLYKTLIPIIYNLSFLQQKLLINYIHLIGNVIINIKQIKFNKQSQLQKINHFLLTKFKLITSSQLDLLIAQTHKYQSAKEIAFLMVWFLRNQLVIMQNCNMFGHHSNNNDSYQYVIHQVNDLWFPILYHSLQIMLQVIKAFPDHEEYHKSVLINIMSAVDFTKVLFNQFNISAQNFVKLLKYLQQLQQCIEASSLNLQGEFLNKIYDLYFNLLCNYENQQSLYKLIVQKACQGLKLEPKYPKIMKLCAKILSPYNKINYQSKQKIFYIFSQNCDSFLSQLDAQSTTYIQLASMLQLYHQAVLQSQNLSTKSQMISDILNPERIGKVLQLCSRIWQQQNNVEDLLMSLQLLKELCDRQQYQSLLKYKIENVGYYQQLQTLSSHTNDKINRLVYEIYQLLQIM